MTMGIGTDFYTESNYLTYSRFLRFCCHMVI